MMPIVGATVGRYFGSDEDIAGPRSALRQLPRPYWGRRPGRNAAEPERLQVVVLLLGFHHVGRVRSAVLSSPHSAASTSEAAA